MSTTTVPEANLLVELEGSPGQQFAKLREKRGYTQEYVALKLHLEIKVIEFLEKDDYESLPQPVFIRGYMRAYAKLLSISPDPFLAYFNQLTIADRKVDKPLWQGRRETNRSEKMIRWLSLLGFISLLIVTATWWQKNNESNLAIKEKEKPLKPIFQKATKTNENLTTISKIQSMFAGRANPTPGETKSG